MKITCAQAELDKNLSIVNRAVPDRPNYPILACIKLEASEDGTVKLTGFDLAMGIQSSFSAIVETGGSVALPAKTARELISRLPDGELTLEVDENHSVALTCSSGQYKIQAMSTTDYPELMDIDVSQTIQLSVGTLKEGLRGTATSASTDVLKQVLNGVHLIQTEKGIEFAATDGHRVAVVYSQDGASKENPLETTIPLPAVRELNGILSGRNEEEIVSLSISVGQCKFSLEGLSLISRVNGGIYPKYQQLIPRRFANAVEVDRRQLMASIDRLAIFDDRKAQIIQLTLDQKEQKLHLCVSSQQLGNGKESISAKVISEQDKFEVQFNCKLLSAGLSIFSTAEVKLQSNHPHTPAVIAPINNESIEYLIMPIQVRD